MEHGSERIDTHHGCDINGTTRRHIVELSPTPCVRHTSTSADAIMMHSALVVIKQSMHPPLFVADTR
jgi:hypothetical protein